jgi:hypothetical protein
MIFRSDESWGRIRLRRRDEVKLLEKNSSLKRFGRLCTGLFLRTMEMKNSLIIVLPVLGTGEKGRIICIQDVEFIQILHQGYVRIFEHLISTHLPNGG